MGAHGGKAIKRVPAPRRSDSEILNMQAQMYNASPQELIAMRNRLQAQALANARRRGGDGGDSSDADADAWEGTLYDHEEQLLHERKNRRRGYRDFAIAISVILVLIGVIILIAYFADAFRNAGTVNGDANGRYAALLGERFTGEHFSAAQAAPANIYEAARMAGMDISFR